MNSYRKINRIGKWPRKPSGYRQMHKNQLQCILLCNTEVFCIYNLFIEWLQVKTWHSKLNRKNIYIYRHIKNVLTTWYTVIFKAQCILGIHSFYEYISDDTFQLLHYSFTGISDLRLNMSRESVLTLIVVLLTIILVDGQRRGECCQDYCYNSDDERPQSAHFASKTSYLVVKGPETGRQYLVPSEYLFIFLIFCLTNITYWNCPHFALFISACNPVKIWIYSRHGTRLPESTFVYLLFFCFSNEL